jgi:hypothetical protein
MKTCSFCLLFALSATAANAGVIYSQGFEADTSGWYDANYDPGGAARVLGAAASGSYYGRIQNINDTYQTGYGNGGFSRLGRTPGVPAAYPGSIFFQSVDVYIDPSTAAPTVAGIAAFWIDMYPSALNAGNPYGDEHDFALYYDGASTTVKADNGNGPTLTTITEQGWYRFYATYAKDSNPLNPVINTLSVQTIGGATLGTTYDALGNSGGVLSSTDLGGPGVIWFTVWQNGFANNVLNIDNVQSGAVSEGTVPEPATFVMMGGNLAVLLILRRRHS